MISAAPFRGPLTIEIGGQQHALGREVAGQVLVESGVKA
jgi:Fe2+ transport system protein FeoA